MGLVANDQFKFPITQSKLGDAIGLSVVHINRILQAFRTQGILDTKRQVVTFGDFEKIVQLGGFDSLEDYTSPE
ncbi:helix-turn-helix domain-containing protein [uncultured Bradyrhizobium sp.]|mgnify:CR=1 FL=1|uniref:helix-turn-helix domain-containing protein n=1 Tax=uncultured Bradyrhizobium sp. TaxID=199684 RepID=UPI002610D0DA|nr:helix-turn-helix domain-containing protein [uncultured Bradyrhizobium sp.]